ncbi:MAG: DUF3794 and LysM peptidoglycan-binding domain-containing protein [Halanaerobiales bacterium]
MPEPIEVSETIAREVTDIELIREVSIPERLPPAERVVSVNASVRITETEAARGSISFEGVVRTSIYYASAQDPSNVVSFRRNFTFSDRVSVSGVRPGYEIDIESAVDNIDFYLINERLIGLEFNIINYIEITSAERISPVEETPDIDIRTRRIRIRRELRERNYTRDITSVERIPGENPDIRRIIDVDSEIQIIDITPEQGRIVIRGNVSSDILYISDEGNVEYLDIEFPFSENFSFRGVTPDMSPFVEAIITAEEAQRIDNRRIRNSVTVNFDILVVVEREVDIPVDIVTPEVSPVTRTILVDRIIAEERTRISARGEIRVPSDNPAVRRVIRASGRIRGTLDAEARSGGVLLTGTVEVNVIYVSDLPNQPVYFTSGRINLNYFVDIPEVESDMDVFVEAQVIRTNADISAERRLSVRSVLEINLVATETVRVSVVTGVGDTDQEVSPEQDYITYEVNSGDTLFLIAQKFGVSVEDIININNIADSGQLQIGQELLIPQ